MSNLNINSRELIAFVALFETVAYKSKFNSVELSLQCLLQLFQAVKVPSINYIMDRKAAWSSRTKPALKEYQLLAGKSPAVHDLDIEQYCQII